MRTLNKLASIILAALLFLLTFTNVQPVSSMFIESPTSQTDSQPYVPDVILLEVQGSASMGLLAGTDSTALNAVLKNLGTRSIKPLFPFEQAASQGVNNLGTTQKQYRVQLGSGTDVMSAVETLAALPEVIFAEPDYIAYPADLPAAPQSVSAYTVNSLSINDPLYVQQWGMAKINIEGAWSSTYGSPTVAIAIIDSGIDLTHVDLAGNLWTNPGEIAGNGLDDDSNGFIDDVDGWNFVASSNDLWDDNGHGTLVAGAAAAVGGNGQGVVGVCPQCKIMPVKVMQASGAANYSDIAAGILYAAQKGAKVINLSLGGYANSNTLKNAIDTAVNTYGVVVVAGAGNDDLNTAFYPAAYDNVLSVAGTAEDDTKMGFSNYAAWVDVSAPAVNVRTTALGGDWANGSGTSIASPFAAGLAGLLRTVHPDWGQATIRSQIVHTTDSIDSANPTFVGMLGTGRLNAGTAMQAPHPLVSMTSDTVNGLASGRPLLGATAQLNITLNNDWWDAMGVTGILSTTDASVTMINASAAYGDIPAATSKTNVTTFSFSVASGAGYNHPIPFKLDITDTTGYTNSFNFTINTETGVVNKSGTIPADETWTNDKTYLIKSNVSVAPGVTLTIQPGTVIKFNGNYAFNVYGTLIADGTVGQPITFQSNTAGTWDKIFFDDLNIDAVADGTGVYLSGSILRYVNIEGNTGGVTCTTATPYLAHVNLKNGGITCTLGATPIWFLDNTIIGSATFTGAGNAYRNSLSGGLTITGAGIVEDNTLGGALSLGSGNARRNTVKNGGLTVGGTLGSIENNTVTGGNVSAGDSFSVLTNTVTGSLTVGNSATVDHNTAGNGITVGTSSTVTWNNVENAAGTGLVVGTGVTAQYNRLIGNAIGMTATTGLIEHNLIANNTGVGLQVGAATVRYNTFTGNKGNTILVQGGTPVTIGYNNLEGNTGTYDLYVNIASGVFVTAQNNWWGTTDLLLIADRVYDWNDLPTQATASYTLRASGPDQTAPGYVRNVTVLPDTTLGIQTGTFEAQFSKPMDINNSPSMLFFNNIKGTWSQYTSSNSGLPINEIRAMAIEGNGTKWFSAYSKGVASFDGTTWTVYNSSNSGLIYDYYINAIASEANGTKWFSTWGGGVTSFDGTTWKVYNSSNSGLPGFCVYAITIEDNGTKWFGTCQDGVASFDGITWRVYTSSNSGLPDNYVIATAIEPNGTKWFGTMSGGVASFDGTTWTVYNSSNSGLPSNGVNAIAIEANGTKWFCTGNGVASFDGTTWKVYNTTNLGLSGCSAGAIAIEAKGTKWFGTFNGAFSFDGTTWKAYNTTNSGLQNGIIYSIAIEANGTKWFGGSSGGVGVLHNAEEYPIIDNQHWPSSSLYRAAYDITSAIPKETYRIDTRDVFDPDGMRVAPYSNTTFNVDYAGFISDITPPVQPTVTASGNGALTSLSANWSSTDAESPITQYRYGIGTTPGARDVVAWTYVPSTTTSMTRTGLNLTSGQPYYVTVGARNEGGLWSDSGVSNGITAGASLPASFNKSTPANGAVSQPAGLTLTWAASTGAAGYDYCYDTTNDNACSTWVDNGTSTSKALSGLSPNTTYYWHVRANNTGGTTYSNGLPTVFWSFTTAAFVPGTVPGAFDKSTPLNIAIDQSTSPTLTWTTSSGAAGYEYCYDTTNDNACSTWVDNGTATSKALSGLSYATTYYWHIRANNTSGSTYSNELPTAFWSFTTAAFVPGTVPGAFDKSAPLNAATAISTSPTITWSASSGMTSYDYCYDTTNDNSCSTWTDNGTSTSKVLSGLSPNTTYYWHIRANNVTGTTYSNGSATAFWSFTTSTIPSGGGSTTGVFRPGNGLLYLKNTNQTGFADVAINYGTGGDYPVAGDWDGNGTATIGIYRNGFFYLRNSNTLGFADIVFAFGTPGDQPVAGDWDGDGVDTIGVYSNGQFLLRNSNSAGIADMSFYLGNPGDVGIAGDWNGDGMDTTGVFRPSNGIIFLKNANTTGFADVALNYGLSGDMPVTGDWNNDGIDTIGVYRNAQFLLRNSNTIGFAEIVFGLGNPGDMPISGNWDGIP